MLITKKILLNFFSEAQTCSERFLLPAMLFLPYLCPYRPNKIAYRTSLKRHYFLDRPKPEIDHQIFFLNF